MFISKNLYLIACEVIEIYKTLWINNISVSVDI